MKNKILSITMFIGLFNFSGFAQMKGNHIHHYQQNRNQTKSEIKISNIQTTDSTLIIDSKILLNKQADHYMVHIGISQFEKTVTDASSKLSNRINRVIKNIRNIGIQKKDTYVDFISKIKVYDHTIEGNQITEYFDGFRIQKNLIIKFKDLNQIDAILEYCALENIHDVIKIDYVNKDLEKIQDLLLAEAEKIVEKKKNRYIRNSSIDLSKRYKVATEHLKIYNPKSLYKTYDEAHETSLVRNNYQSSYIRKEERKATTYYYDGIDRDYGVDKIIDDISPVVGIQYVFELRMVYYFDFDFAQSTLE